MGRSLIGSLALGAAVAAAGYRRQALDRSGAIGAALVGAATIQAGSWRWSAPLLAFFAGSSALSRLERMGAGGQAIAAMAARGACRDLAQVVANGGIPTLIALAQIAAPRQTLTAAFAGAFAAANGDTWATEIGGLSPIPPRMILDGRLAEPGVSGAVTPLGLAGAVAGSAVIGLVAAMTMQATNPARRAVAITLAGMTGSLVDSLAGATIQAAYQCPACRRLTERRMHCDGTATVLVRGRPWCTNETVNALCTAVGAVVGAVLTGRS